MKVRIVKTKSSASAVQVIRYYNNKRIVLKHFGSCHTEDELKDLVLIAEEWIKDYSGQLSIFPSENPNSILVLSQSSFLGVHYSYFYELILKVQCQIGFDTIRQPLLRDLVLMRLFEPASKLRSIDLLALNFGIKHRRQTFYELAPSWLKLKNKVEQLTVEFAKQQFDFSYDLLFYDVTTLYFETFEDDELRKCGFSKDSKSQQPQILVALMVTKEGFPISYEVFAGNTFEGNTILPVIQNFIQKHSVKHFTVVADAAMISKSNIEELTNSSIHYIVGARLGNLNADMINQIDKALLREEAKTIRLKTDKGFLICSFSKVRYRKDKYEMEKQIEKAKQIIETPSKKKKVKFTSSIDEKLSINQDLIDKSTKLLGIKGYYTDIDESIISNQLAIERYHELYRIEQAFRISKNDLETRPIYHFKEEPIKMHLLICFMALSIAKVIEIKLGISIQKFKNETKKITDARMFNKITNKEIKIRTDIPPHIFELEDKLFRPH